ncbi:hypothetical protein DAPPUDRAFT_251999 [Daphnia pulex]|uniref:RING-type E3 ubiquitin transferase n=1 Tax=Daphnia pulex TaxID=6669 RepID=E9H1P9_DAPPU|nr:hypothetical protein DAPPUDRAFT_251999 [Daphnia pulex]|eukprot:EFX74333.1 hypothetical protein DAPPUDRAFT_251999 [Daphnia pulex]
MKNNRSCDPDIRDVTHMKTKPRAAVLPTAALLLYAVAAAAAAEGSPKGRGTESSCRELKDFPCALGSLTLSPVEQLIILFRHHPSHFRAVRREVISGLRRLTCIDGSLDSRLCTKAAAAARQEHTIICGEDRQNKSGNQPYRRRTNPQYGNTKKKKKKKKKNESDKIEDHHEMKHSLDKSQESYMHLQSDTRNWERDNWTADGKAEVAASATIIITKETSMASIVDDLLDEGTPRMNITVETAESVYLIQSSAWRSGRTQWPQTPAEKAAEKMEYYKAYDPLTGLKIAATLSGFLTMAVLYVFYKSLATYRVRLMKSNEMIELSRAATCAD